MISYILKWYFNMISFRKKSPRIYNRKWQPDWLMFNDIPFKMIPFQHQKVGWHCNDRFTTVMTCSSEWCVQKWVCIFARLRRVPAVWCSKDNASEWYQLNIRQSAEKGFGYPYMNFTSEWLWSAFRNDRTKLGINSPIFSPLRKAIPPLW